MTALSADRDTRKIETAHKRNLPVAAAKKLYAGALVAVDANGRATPGAVATTLKGIGRAMDQYDNSAGSAGDISADVETGIFRFGNSASGDAITNADIGNDCYIVDDQTVAKTDGSGARSIAGKVHLVDSVGVWVRFS